MFFFLTILKPYHFQISIRSARLLFLPPFFSRRLALAQTAVIRWQVWAVWRRFASSASHGCWRWQIPMGFGSSQLREVVSWVVFPYVFSGGSTHFNVNFSDFSETGFVYSRIQDNFSEVKGFIYFHYQSPSRWKSWRPGLDVFCWSLTQFFFTGRTLRDLLSPQSQLVISIFLMLIPKLGENEPFLTSIVCKWVGSATTFWYFLKGTPNSPVDQQMIRFQPLTPLGWLKSPPSLIPFI